MTDLPTPTGAAAQRERLRKLIAESRTWPTDDMVEHVINAGFGEINATSADDALRQVVDFARRALAPQQQPPASGTEGA